MTEHLFTKIILSLYTMNVVYYGSYGDYPRAAYWFFAAGITVCANWLIK